MCVYMVYMPLPLSGQQRDIPAHASAANVSARPLLCSKPDCLSSIYCSYLFRGYSQAVSGGINVVWLLLMVVGLGSIYFHATLSFAGQLIDELAIAWVVLAGFTIWMPPHLLQRWPLNGSR